MIFPEKIAPQAKLRAAITAAYRMDEAACVESVLPQAALSAEQLVRVQQKAAELIKGVRAAQAGHKGLGNLLHEYQLSSEEGVALMCLAEAMLRVPDKQTVHRLIRDKIATVDWKQHLGKSDSFFINAVSWGLLLTGKILSRDDKTQQKSLLNAAHRLLERSAEPVIRTAMGRAMTILGSQFVCGQTIEESLAVSKKYHAQGYQHTYDMLGEAARSEEKAQQYLASYHAAIESVGKQATSADIHRNPAVSIKLSALHPRYEFSQQHTVLPILIERVKALALQAKAFNIGCVIDAEEADRLDISLDVVEALAADPDLQGWNGLGLAVQAYQKRALPVLDWLIDLAQRTSRRLMVRLVKGAYWDAEIKDSQVRGLAGYPVFTRKTATDVNYLACAKKMLAAPVAIYPQFGTHNAFTIAAVMELVGERRDFEFQCLHGMGHFLYDQLVNPDPALGWPCRVYAPVGTHEDLLSYLVRRILENGANSSFMHQVVDPSVSVETLVADPVAKLASYSEKAHPSIPLPLHLYNRPFSKDERLNSRGIDMSNWEQLAELQKKMDVVDIVSLRSGIPANASQKDVITALDKAQSAAAKWDQVSIEQRASYLEKAADLFEANQAMLMSIAVREAGKTIPSALAEVREAVDFCRYYAVQARQELSVKTLPGPTGELNQLSMHGRGIAVCISPWNFPLAIFTGQVVAALVSGNVVVAKPAEQTPLMAVKAVELLHQAGIPQDVLQLLLGTGETVGAALVADSRVSTVLFTGSTETARAINQALAQRPGPLATFIAETGGQNAMIVDSTALPEQVIVDVVQSAFDSAGQRCSALRVLYLQDDIADNVINLLKGAMAEIKVGDPSLLATDIGPVIDQDAKTMLEKHKQYLYQHGKLIYEVPVPDVIAQQGLFFGPCAFEIASLDLLKREVFGPVLHVIRYAAKDLDKVIAAINNTGYGLTLGIHSRIHSTIEYIRARMRVGNVYVNRNMIGAVVGVQPFGGEGLSGTGPKAGGPHYLPRLCVERTVANNIVAMGGNARLLGLGD